MHFCWVSGSTLRIHTPMSQQNSEAALEGDCSGQAGTRLEGGVSPGNHLVNTTVVTPQSRLQRALNGPHEVWESDKLVEASVG